MIALAVGTLILAALADRTGSHFSPADLEAALDAEAGERFGSDAADPDGALRGRSSTEVFLQMDPGVVPDHLLVGILIAGATRGSPADAAQRLLMAANGDITQITRADVVRDSAAIGRVGLARLLAAKELVRRQTTRARLPDTISSSTQAVQAAAPLFYPDRESLVVLFMDQRHNLLARRTMTQGSAAFTIVDPRQVFRAAIEMGASSVILLHNHPSGDPTPSHQDRDVTRRCESAGRALGIRVLDHIVVARGGETFRSFAEEGSLPAWEGAGSGWTGP